MKKKIEKQISKIYAWKDGNYYKATIYYNYGINEVKLLTPHEFNMLKSKYSDKIVREL